MAHRGSIERPLRNWAAKATCVAFALSVTAPAISADADDCKDAAQRSRILAPSTLIDGQRERIEAVLRDFSIPGVTIDAPSNSGMLRLRSQQKLKDSEWQGVIEKVSRKVSAADLTLVTLGADQRVPAVPVSPPEMRLAGASSNYGDGLERIEILEAWTRTRGVARVLVAVVDSGVQLDHVYQLGSIWLNLVEAQGVSGVDEDRNGVTDDVVGADFYLSGRTGRPYRNKYSTHGTAIASIVAGIEAPEEHFAGTAPLVRVLPARVMNSSFACEFDLARGIEYSAVTGASVINVSFASPDPLPAVKRAVQFSATKKALIVTAAGNAGVDLEETPYYPAAYSLTDNDVPNQIVVMNSPDEPTARSNCSRHIVHIAAPAWGRAAVSGSNKWAPVAGTSVAAPYVAGTAALLKSLNPAWGFAELKSHLLESARSNPRLRGKSIDGKDLNASDALTGPLELMAQDGVLAAVAGVPLTIQWNPRYPSSYCRTVSVQLKGASQMDWVTLGTATDGASQLRFELPADAATGDLIQLRCGEANFRSERASLRFD